jgi:hypothetical protein
MRVLEPEKYVPQVYAAKRQSKALHELCLLLDSCTLCGAIHSDDVQQRQLLEAYRFAVEGQIAHELVGSDSITAVFKHSCDSPLQRSCNAFQHT